MEDFEVIDIHDNKISCIKNTVYVVVPGAKFGKKRRVIGIFNGKGNFVKGFHKKLEVRKHRFRKNEGWGINYEVVDRMGEDDKVIVNTDIGVFSITVEKIKSEKSVFQFSKQGYELQYIIPQNIMEQIK